MFSASKSKGASGSYQIANSLRFRSSASAYLNRTPATTTNQTTFTFSFWFKTSTAGNGRIYVGRTGINFPAFGITVGVSGGSAMTIDQYGPGAAIQLSLVTSQIFRDPSAWYHAVIAIDTTQATASNRVKAYVNGSQVTSFSTATYPSQNQTINVNTANTQYIGADPANSGYFDGYITEFNFIDGQALTPSSFGQINTTTGVWQPKAYSGTYGTNGFKLNFSNGTSTTTLGYDSSGNGNNWTTNNISLTAGTTYDWMLDSPTPLAGTSYGVGNYAVLNPLANSYNGKPTFSNANLTIAPNVANYQTAWSSFNVTSSKWYCEFLVTGTPNSANIIGISSTSEIAYCANNTNAFVGYTSTGYAYYIYNGNKYNNATSTAYGSAVVSGDVVAIALDLDNGKVWFGKNGTWQASGDPVAGTNAAFTGIVGSNGFSFGATVYNGGVSSFSANFGQRPFSYTPPTGYKSLCTYNLPAASIVNGASYMAATLYTGSGGSTKTVSGVPFQPDLVWLKDRSTAWNNCLFDVVRGTGKLLQSNLTNAETTNDAWGYLSAFNSNGFTLTAGASGIDQVSQNGDNYVAWQWKANGTAVSNTAGSITSQVSANTTAGFSVVTWTAPASGTSTVGHGLGVAPSFFIIKNRPQVDNWQTWHSALGGTQYLTLNTTNAVATNANVFSSAPTYTVLNFGTNITGTSFVAYCFAAIPGYSAFGSYTGNGSTDGPFVYTNFKPRFVMVKCSSAVSDWTIVDTSRSPYNLSTATLFPNSSAAEGTGFQIDVLSNGFKLRATGVNTNSATYIYAAFAESPFTNSLAQ